MRTRSLALVSFCAALAVIQSAAAAQEDKFLEIPVTKAVLYSSGVGYFEHSGSVEGDAAVRLMFKTSQINDVLKSMVLMDMDGGTINRATYGSNDPVDRALRSFGVDISGAPTLPELLKQLRGAEVTVDGVTGKILSVEAEEKVVGEPPTKVTEWLLRLVTEKGIKTVRLSATTEIVFTDKKMQAELNEALTLLIGAKDTDRKAVDLHFSGKGKRRVRIGYIVESPVWKTSYRLDLSDKPLIQGWAILENASDNDWKNVGLSLVSGRPISFIQDLYTPLYVDRPVVQPELYASLKPRVYEEGIEREQAAKRLSEAKEDTRFARNRAAAPGAPSAEAGFAYKAEKDAQNRPSDEKFDLGSSVTPVASGSSIGELFEFSIHHPVDLQRRRSAMLPIVNQPVKAEKVSIYNQSQHATQPLNGVYLTNDTGMKLLAGPVTVFDGGKYAGDARIGHLAANEKRLLSYAVDLAMTIDPSVNNSSRIVSAKLVRGVLHVNRVTTFTQTYKIKNKAEQKRIVIVEHPFINGRNLTDPKTYEEKTPALYRFRVNVDAKSTGDFVVEETQPGAQQIAIYGASPNSYLGFLQEGTISADVKKALEKAAALQNELSVLENQLNQFRQQKAQIEQGQDRLRRNIDTAGRDTELGKRYLSKLAEEETTIEKLEVQINDTQKKVDAKRKELADYLNGLDLN